MKKIIFLATILVAMISCQSKGDARKPTKQVTVEQNVTDMQKNLSKYVTVKLTADIDKLTDNERKMLPLLIQAADIMNDLFWYESYGDKEALLNSIDDADTKRFVEINYGPWDRLNGNKSFMSEFSDKPLGANYYPKDMTKDEFEASNFDKKGSIYTFVRRDDAGKLYAIPYHQQFAKELKVVSDLLKEASTYADNAGLKKYLELRSLALLDDEYQASDLAWMDMKTNTLDIVIGPIETYEDHIYSNKASHEGYVLIKDQAWSAKLAKFSAYLPELQKDLPVDAAYKTETPGTDSDLNADRKSVV